MKCPGTEYCLSLILVYLSYSGDLLPLIFVRRASSYITNLTCLASSKLQV